MLDANSQILLTVGQLRDGDILAALCDPESFWGGAIGAVGKEDAEEKGVPLCQHTLMKTTKYGEPHQLEAVVRIREVPLDQSGRYLVLRARFASRAQISNAIMWGRHQINRPYGVANLFRMLLNLLLKKVKIHLDANDRWLPICSQFNAEQYDQGGYPVLGNGSEDHEITPWDWLCPPILNRFHIVGRFGDGWSKEME